MLEIPSESLTLFNMTAREFLRPLKVDLATDVPLQAAEALCSAVMMSLAQTDKESTSLGLSKMGKGGGAREGRNSSLDWKLEVEEAAAEEIGLETAETPFKEVPRCMRGALTGRVRKSGEFRLRMEVAAVSGGDFRGELRPREGR